MSVSNYILLVGLCIIYVRLPAGARKRRENFLPFLYALIYMTIDPLGLGVRIFQDVNGAVNEFFGNIEKPFYNAWIYNIILRMILPVLTIILIQTYVPPRQKTILQRLWIGFAVFATLFQFLQVEPIYLNQGVLVSVGSLCMLVSCFVYFYTLITRDEYIFKNILLLPSFWQITFILFYTALTYFNNVSLTYLDENHRAFLVSMFKVDKFTGVVQSLVFILCLAAPMLKIKVENQPSYA